MPSQGRQRGAATLVVVMVLFLVMALLAAYANRSLMFEQRVSSSYFRASLAQEAAEGGVDWTLAQLNGVAIDGACLPVDSGGQRFADRYLDIDPVDRSISPKPKPKVTDPQVDCARDEANEGWACRCIATSVARTKPTAMNATLLAPSFSVLMKAGARNGTLQLAVVGCTDSVVDQCADSVVSATLSRQQLGKSRVGVLVGLVGAVRNPPAAPLIAKGNLITSGTGGLGLHNTDPRSAGLLYAIGGTSTGLVDSRLESVPGTAPNQARVEDDNALKLATADDVFKMFMGASPAVYPQHPSLRVVTCGSECSGALDDAYKAGKRILLVQGPLSINSSKVLASLTDPVLIIATGAVTLGGAFQINGMLVSGGALTWTGGGAAPALINGIVLAQGNVQTTGRMDIAYQQTVADQLRNRMGSYVRVPGSWQDANF